jgi:hypothetical protein
MGMKNKLPLLLAVVALFGFTATAAEAHPVPPGHYYYHHHYYHYYHGYWYNEAGVVVSAPGFVISFGF